ncbi:MAG: thiamine pyrophosphate-dependent enzyme [Planctomycetales bacterium]|nr:thiamine pyrophosphate-dependent enzyme [Planctomycetales bacterium]
MAAPSPIQRAEVVDRNVLDRIASWEGRAAPHGEPEGPIREGAGLTRATALRLFESQVLSRHLDLEARALRARAKGYYTIGSAGHEGNVVLGALARHTDPALLHYRSGALFVERARQVPGVDPVLDILLGMVASADDPASGGRHKVFGSEPLSVLPQTSTIASHLPKAVGLALFHERGKFLRLPLRWPAEAIVLCSFGDASVNHAVAQTAFNAASYVLHRKLALPILFVCEDNGIGISVPTPAGWIERSFADRPGIRYLAADGLDLAAAWDATAEAVAHVRERRQPVFLHLRVARLLAHAGSDVETTYHTLEEIAAEEAKDPLLRSVDLLCGGGAASSGELRDLYERARARVREAAAEALRRPKLSTAAQVVAALAPNSPERVRAEAARADYGPARSKLFGGEANLPERGKPRHLAALLSAGLLDLLAKYPEMFVFGEDVGKKGGVYHATADLQARAGPARVFDTLLDETTILGLAIGAGLCGYLPVPEIQYLAYVHNAEDQLRGEACSQQFFSAGKVRNPMVVRIASFGYQEGFGGHFHNDSSLAVLRDMPGLVVAVPSRGDDAVGMLRTCLAAARVDGRVSAFCEPIALYMQRDLHAPGDSGWCFPFPPPGEAVALGEPRLYDVPGEGVAGAPELLLVAYANGVRLALRAARKLGRRARVMDLRWIAPLPAEAIRREAAAAGGRVLVVDEGRRSGGVAEAVGAALLDDPPARLRMRRVTGDDTYVPLGDAWRLTFPSEEGILAAAREMLAG